MEIITSTETIVLIEGQKGVGGLPPLCQHSCRSEHLVQTFLNLLPKYSKPFSIYSKIFILTLFRTRKTTFKHKF